MLARLQNKTVQRDMTQETQILTTDCLVGVSDRAMTSEHHWLIRSKALMFHSRHAALLMSPMDWTEPANPRHPTSRENSSSTCDHRHPAICHLLEIPSMGRLHLDIRLNVCVRVYVPGSQVSRLHTGGVAVNRTVSGRADRTAVGWIQWTEETTHWSSTTERRHH